MKKWVVIGSVSLLLVVGMVLLFFAMFPRKYKEEITKYSNEFNLPTYMVASVINIESGYDKFSTSKVGAKGLMQLLPTTAEDCAMRMGITIQEGDLENEDINIRLGCFYLRYLLDRYDGNIINTLSAYNWGYGNVNDWIDMGNIDANGSVINIPVEETQNYLTKYRLNEWIYKFVYQYK